ncbi:hypothetical protein B0H21DRAFT_777390 [Amylocystis lapponica]|nr:hypothetical protein B0H21DRAFT_777390 [Amylocystis lapponica]
MTCKVRQVPALRMSNIIASDAPLSSPLSDTWDHQLPCSPTIESMPLTYANYVSRSPSVCSSAGMLKSRMSPEGSEPEQQLCLPTSQVFDIPSSAPSPESDASEQQEQPRLSICINPNLVPSKRASSTAPHSSKKARASGERITTRDFIPPDVSGLSKREARLVKNRAAAFLSRQRKREEFETMEIRVAELEQENARLMALTQNAQEETQDELQSEVEKLRAQLAAVEQRERKLAEELSTKASSQAQVSPVKMEAAEPQLPAPMRSVSVHKSEKSGASFGLMVLLCALPTLLSMPSHSTLPTTFSLPLSSSHSSALAASAAFDMHPFFGNDFEASDYDWSIAGGSSVMDLDIDENPRVPSTASASVARKLEFVDVDSEALGLGGLDISFDASPSENGKIRVRIHPPAPAAASPPQADAEDQVMWGETGSTLFAAHKLEDTDPLGPFLGVGGDYKLGMNTVAPDGAGELGSVFDFDSDYSGSSVSGFSREGSPSAAGRRRVRIALKSLPGAGREGGEWEVEVC